MGCCGSTTTPTGAGAAAVDTGKRVNYTQGMLLGVDDFVQEQAWEMARRHELAREVLGYGTLRGLKVSIDPGAPRVRVTPGMAWMPSGAPVCVPSEQCCDINAWLAGHWGEVGPQLQGLPQPAPFTVYVVLAYDSCLTDRVPVPGEPCRSEDALTVDSRIADCFRLELRSAPPDQVEENAIRDFADWLAKVPLDSSSPPLSDEDFLAQLREAATAWLEPTSPHPQDFMFGSPPPGLASTDALLRAALRLWATELRPLWRARFGCGPDPSLPGGTDDAVLLAALELRVFSATQEADAGILVNEDARPILASLRLVQELIAQNPVPEPAQSVVPALDFGLDPEIGHDSAYARADHSHGTPDLPPLAGDVSGPLEANVVGALNGVVIETTALNPGDVLAYSPLGTWAPTQPPKASDAWPEALVYAGDGAVGASNDFARSDHVHPLPAAPEPELPELGGDVQGDITNNVVVGLQSRPVADIEPTLGEILIFKYPDDFGAPMAWTPSPLEMPQATEALPAALVFGPADDEGEKGGRLEYARADHRHALPQLPELRGDASGAIDDVTVSRLQRVPLNAAQPGRGDVLTFDGTAWVAATGGTAHASEVVAAGEIAFTLDSLQPSAVKVLRPLGKLSVADGGIAFLTTMIRVDMHATPSGAAPRRPGYIVKVTPTLPPDYLRAGGTEPPHPVSRSPIWIAYAAGEVTDSAVPGQIDFSVLMLPFSDISRMSADFIFQIEVSRYEVAG